MTEFARDYVKNDGQGHAVPGVLHWLPGLFLLAVLGVGALLTLTSPGARTVPQDQNVTTGQWTAAYEKGLDADVPWRRPALDLWGGAQYRLFGEARPGAVVGRDGWLYTSEEFETAPADARELRDKLRYVGEVRRDLARDGARLVVALVPSKARLYSSHLGGVRVPAAKATQYETFRRGLEAEGIIAPDLYAALRWAKTGDGPNLFFRTDTHWTPDGAGVAARAVASQVRALGLEFPAGDFRAARAAPAIYPGDLLRYLPGAERAPSTSDWVRARSTERVSGGGGLLGDEGIAVTLVGTSYSAASSANVWDFAGQLQQALGTEVLNVADQGRGPFLPMRDYLRSPERTSSPPQVVIWEIPERYLRVDYPGLDNAGAASHARETPGTPPS
ncbi:alginate O-acetyltransferase [Deinococcus apachensis]|uniref:alginate O-acetyltransferase n=1 Tax=Deinococcus apachensis TaxID=309886 RepID=UPI00037DA0A9|nr:alginate O-acetyltransferase [Deinococcus apachensis]